MQGKYITSDKAGQDWILTGNVLSKDEEEKALAQLGGEHDKEAKNKLIEHNLRLVVHIVKKYGNINEEICDLISVGTIGLIKAVNTFKPEKGNLLATYAGRCIENEINYHIRKVRKWNKDVALDEPFYTDADGSELTLADILYDESKPFENDVETEMAMSEVRKALSKLSAREREVLELRYEALGAKEVMKQVDVAKAVGISQSYMSRVESSALDKLKKELLHCGYQY